MRKLMAIVVVLLAAAAVYFGGKYFFGRLDVAVERELESAASEAFGTNVTVDDVQIELLDRQVTIQNLAIGNPEGFKGKNAFVFGNIEASVDFTSMSVEQVILDDAQIFVEERNGRINVQELKKGVQSGVSGAVDVGQPSDEELHIKRFVMRGTTATLESDSLQKESELRVDEIEMLDLRGTPEAIAGKIASQVVNEISREAQRAIVRAKAEEVGERALDKLKGLLQGDDENDGG